MNTNNLQRLKDLISESERVTKELTELDLMARSMAEKHEMVTLEFSHANPQQTKENIFDEYGFIRNEYLNGGQSNEQPTGHLARMFNFSFGAPQVNESQKKFKVENIQDFVCLEIIGVIVRQTRLRHHEILKEIKSFSI